MNIQGQELKNQRLNHGWTQEQFAMISDVSTRTVQRAERLGQASIDSVSAFCSVLEIDRDMLITEKPIGTDPKGNTPWLIVLAFLLGGLSGYLVFHFLG